MQAGLVLGTFDGLLLGMARDASPPPKPTRPRPTPRERSLLAAFKPWAEGDLRRGQTLLERHVIDHPRDLLALQLAHQSDLVLGQHEMLRDRIGRALAHWSPADPATASSSDARLRPGGMQRVRPGRGGRPAAPSS